MSAWAQWAGKTTLLNILAGLAQPHAGRIRLAGRDIAGLTPAQIARLLAYLPQSTDPTFAYTLRDFVVMGRTPHLPRFASPGRHDYEIADAALARLGLAELGGRALTEVSGGQRQKATIARALSELYRVRVTVGKLEGISYPVVAAELGGS